MKTALLFALGAVAGAEMSCGNDFCNSLNNPNDMNGWGQLVVEDQSCEYGGGTGCNARGKSQICRFCTFHGSHSTPTCPPCACERMNVVGCGQNEIVSAAQNATVSVATAVEESHECPIIDWLKQHGADAFDTLLECKNVPAAIKAFQESGCHMKTGMMDKVSMALWEAITILEHLNGTIPDIVKHSDIAAKVKAVVAKRMIKSSDEQLTNWCEHAQCEELQKKLMAAISPCYASLTCNFMTSVLPYGECKEAFSTYMSNVMDVIMGSMCDTEDLAGGKYYCAQLNVDLMFRDFDCYVEMKQTSGALAKCTPRCVELWQGAEKKLPKCSKELLNMNQEMYKNVLTLMKDISKYSKHPIPTNNMPKTIPNYDDICGHSPTTITV